jgi:hypothetical protein
MINLTEKIKHLVHARLKEESATGTGASVTTGGGVGVATKYAYRKTPKETDNIYRKLGFKPVNKKQLRKKSKFIEPKDLWTHKLNEDFNLDDYLNSLGIEDKKLKKHIAGRIADFNEVETKLNTLIPLLKKAKQDTINYYKANPSSEIKYSTSVANEYLDDLIELFQPQ